MKRILQASTIIVALLTVANAQAQTGGKEGMQMSKDTSIHHQFKGSALHETAASAHSRAAEHHKKAAAMYRKKADSNAIKHAEAAIFASDDAFSHTEATKELLPK